MSSYTGGPSQGGDSGEPMYIPGASGQVFARGIAINLRAECTGADVPDRR